VSEFIKEFDLDERIENIYQEYFWHGEIEKAPDVCENFIIRTAQHKNIKLEWDISIDEDFDGVFELGLS
jgi:hypothetical protein